MSPSVAACVAVAVSPLQHHIPRPRIASVSEPGAAKGSPQAEVLTASHVPTLQCDFSTDGQSASPAGCGPHASISTKTPVHFARVTDHHQILSPRFAMSEGNVPYSRKTLARCDSQLVLRGAAGLVTLIGTAAHSTLECSGGATANKIQARSGPAGGHFDRPTLELHHRAQE